MLEVLIQIIARGVSKKPRHKALAQGRRWGRFLFSVLRFKRGMATKNLSSCFPDYSRQQVNNTLRSMYENLGMNIIEMLRVFHLGGDDLFDHVVFDESVTVDEQTAKKAPFLFLMGHIGNWEALGAFTKKMQTPVSVVVKELRMKGSQKLLEVSRANMGLNLIPTRNAFRPCLKKLKIHEPVSIILDQNTRRRYGIFTTFFGRSACTTPGLAILSATSRTPVRLVYALRQPDYSHRAYMSELIPPPAGKDPENLKIATQRYNDLLEDVIRKHPDHWIWLHDRWRTQPKKTQQRLT